MKRGHAKHGRPVAADAGTAVAADMVVAAKVVASEEATDEFADNHSGRVFGQGWIRTSEGVKPADLQSAPFGHFGTYPFKREGSYRLALHGSQVVRSGRWVISNDEIRMTKKRRHELSLFDHSSFVIAWEIPRLRSE